MRLLQSQTIALAFLGAVPVLAQDEEPEVIANIVENVEIHQDYGAPIEAHTRFLTEDDGTTKFQIGVNTEYLSQGPVTTTIDNKPVTTTITSHIVVSTATKTSEEIKDKDVFFLMPENLRKEVHDVVMEAYDACSIAAKSARRQEGTCMLDRLAESAQSDSFLSSVTTSEWEGFGVTFAKDAPAIIKHYAKMFAGLTTTEEKFYIGAAAMVLMGIEITKTVLPPKDDVKDLPPGLKFPQGQFGGVDVKQGGGQGGSPTQECPYPTETPNEEWPACSDEDCMGKSKICTAEGENKDCPCINYAKKEIGGDYYDVLFGLNQQKILDKAERELFGAETEPTCDEKADLSAAFSPELFVSADKNTQGDYCKKWDKTKESRMLVDPDGTASGLLNIIAGRSPEGWLMMEYKPKEDGGECGQTCTRAFERLTNSCSVNAEMRGKGTYDIGCGEFEFEIVKPKKTEEPPPPPPPPPPPSGEDFEEKSVVCWGSGDYSRTGDTTPKNVIDLAPELCKYDAKPVVKGDQGTFRHYKVQDKWPRSRGTYQYNIWWLDGCELQNGHESQDVWNPQGYDSWKDDLCQNYFIKAYDQCDNGGRGGVIQVGCLMYEFAAYKTPRDVFDRVIW